jgi:hypothetical protein
MFKVLTATLFVVGTCFAGAEGPFWGNLLGLAMLAVSIKMMEVMSDE